MKGYITFLLVFAGIAIVLATIFITIQARPNQARAIEAKRLYYLEIDIKNTLLDLAKQGADKAVKQYIAEEVAKAVILERPPQFNREEAERRARKGAFEEM